MADRWGRRRRWSDQVTLMQNGHRRSTTPWTVSDVEGGGHETDRAWNRLINGRATTAPKFDDKDDQLHSSLRMIDPRFGPNWAWGDTYTFQATHHSPATQTTYVSAYNMCRLVPRLW